MNLAEVNDQSVASTQRRVVQGQKSTVFTDIYQPDVNMAIWQRTLSLPVQAAVQYLIQTKRAFQYPLVVDLQDTESQISQLFGEETQAVAALTADMAELVAMFCCLFGIERVGLRLTLLERAMCPKFHVDRVPCRLVTTYQGIATEWLPHDAVVRHENDWKYQSEDICHLKHGNVALLKGTSWPDNEHAGLVHRSPAVLSGEYRLLLTLDFVN